MVSKEFFHLLPKNSESQSVTEWLTYNLPFRFEDRTLLLHLKVRFLRYWEARNVRRGGELMGVDMLRLDSQEDDPTIPVVKLFPSGEFPEGEIQHNLWRTTSEEERDLERLDKSQYTTLYARLQKFIASIVKPGMLTTDVCETLEDTVRKLISENGLKAGITFPTGCSLNWVAAHWTPNSGDKTVLQYDDVMKVDFATHIDGMTANFSFVSPLYKSQIETNISWFFAGDIFLNGIVLLLWENGTLCGSISPDELLSYVSLFSKEHPS
ncbi:hypothetical protein HID58_041924 [Brassica napus]|uniref:Peptidase M24 domain-containing protein n=1 Tax=Brassica napus TaxID=3708 RepID=A0ABQ8BDU8_BRANA|nr:hypothetical protein HID58_041924 [Brassica napus]